MRGPTIVREQDLGSCCQKSPCISRRKFFFSENIWNLVGIYTYVLITKLKSSTVHIKYLHFRTTVEFVPLT